MVRSASGIISTSWWQPSASTARRTSPPGTDNRRMSPSSGLKRCPEAPPNRPSLSVSMGRGGSTALLREPFRDLARLDDDLLVHLPHAVFLDQRIELVLGQPELVDEPILRREHVRNARDVPLDLPRVHGEVEDLDVRERHPGLLLLHPHFLVLPLLHRLRNQLVHPIE